VRNIGIEQGERLFLLSCGSRVPALLLLSTCSSVLYPQTSGKRFLIDKLYLEGCVFINTSNMRTVTVCLHIQILKQHELSIFLLETFIDYIIV
jgi:hypothetical protein